MLIISPPVCSPRRPTTEGEWGSLLGSASSGGRSCNADLSLGEVSADATGRPKGRVTQNIPQNRQSPVFRMDGERNPRGRKRGANRHKSYGEVN